MKNTSIYLLPFLLLFFLFACKKDNPVNLTPPPDNSTEEPDPVLEDTIKLKSYRYTYSDTINGFVQGIWQDSFLWEASGVAAEQYWHLTHPDLYLSFVFFTYEGDFGFGRETMQISEIPLGITGDYKISGTTRDIDDGFPGSRFYTAMDGGDVLEDDYIVDETAPDNQLTITEVDTAEQIYRGHFTVSFQVNTTGGKKNPDNPDNFTIRDAEFWVRVIE